jgi:hypothetical protein
MEEQLSAGRSERLSLTINVRSGERQIAKLVKHHQVDTHGEEVRLTIGFALTRDV